MDFNDPSDEFLVKNFELWDPFFLQHYFEDDFEQSVQQPVDILSNSQPPNADDLLLAKALDDYEQM